MSITLTEAEREALERVAEAHNVSASSAVGAVFEWLDKHPELAAKALRRPK